MKRSAPLDVNCTLCTLFVIGKTDCPVPDPEQPHIASEKASSTPVSFIKKTPSKIVYYISKALTGRDF